MKTLPGGGLAADKPAPAGWVYCSVCRAYEHPRWHEPLWREERRATDTDESWADLVKYTKAPR